MEAMDIEQVKELIRSTSYVSNGTRIRDEINKFLSFI